MTIMVSRRPIDRLRCVLRSRERASATHLNTQHAFAADEPAATGTTA